MNRSVLLVIVLLAACSGAGHGATSAERAAAGVVVTGDLPQGFGPTAFDAARDSRTSQLCLGAPAGVIRAGAGPKAFLRGQVEVTSRSVLLSSQTDASKRVGAYASPKAEGCLRQEVDEGLRGAGLTVTGFTATPEKVQLDHAYAFTLDISATTSSGFAIHVTDYWLGAAVGATEISLRIRKSADTGLTLDDARGLLTTLARRVTAAS